ncbi:MAG TPA: translation initiation factor IF-3 [Candidatus Paceibacterota bacterium]
MIHNQPKINSQITTPEVRVLSETGENLGVMSREAALKLAEEKNLDLIEISASAKPPVARIMNFDKFRYEQTKKLKKQRVEEKPQEMKQVQIGIGTAANDLKIKVKKVEEFLSEKHPVVIVLVLRGREKANKDWARLKLGEFLKMIPLEYKILFEPRFGGRGLAVQIAKR